MRRGWSGKVHDGLGMVKDFRINYEKELNPAQYRAVTTLEGPQLVIAGAGTGKTRTLVYRVAYLVEQGIVPQSILLLTFTRKSAQEMMRRAAEMVDERCSLVSGGTFHAFANRVLRRYASAIDFDSRFTIVDRGDAEDILNLLRTEQKLHRKERRFPRKAALLNMISRSRNTGKSLEEILKQEYPQFAHELEAIEALGEAYRGYKKNHNVMDYDDLLEYLRDLLRQQDSVRRLLSNQYGYIMVDEFQDTNRLQAEIAYLLCDEHDNIMVVGDDCQSIYSFRGADFRNIMDFPKRFPHCVVTTLEQNYRSVQPILSLTNAIIEQAQEKYTKTLFSKMECQRRPLYYRASSEALQSFFVCERIRELLDRGVKGREIAVLFRAGWHSNQLEVALNKRGIPFVKYGGLKFIEAAHVKDVLAFLRVLINPRDGVAWNRMLQLVDGIGAVGARQIISEVVAKGGGYDGLVHSRFAKRKYGDDLRQIRDLMVNLSSADTAPGHTVTAVLGFYDPLMVQRYDDAHKRKNDLESLQDMAASYASLEDFLADVTLESPEQSLVAGRWCDGDDDSVVLSTIHSAKGLEWDTVFIIHLVDGFLPSSYAFFDEKALEEERRLFYVAATRAKRRLLLISPQVRARSAYQLMEDGQPSRFLFEIKNLSSLTERIY